MVAFLLLLASEKNWVVKTKKILNLMIKRTIITSDAILKSWIKFTIVFFDAILITWITSDAILTWITSDAIDASSCFLLNTFSVSALLYFGNVERPAQNDLSKSKNETCQYIRQLQRKTSLAANFTQSHYPILSNHSS